MSSADPERGCGLLLLLAGWILFLAVVVCIGGLWLAGVLWVLAVLGLLCEAAWQRARARGRR